MAKSANQKMKLLYLMRILLEKTDETHSISVPEMISELAHYDISAERKSIYDDIEALRLFGLDIVQTKSRTTGYYVASREFELPELKLLVDSVQSSKFITQKKTLSLIKKIESLASVYDAQLLQRQVYVRNRVKSMNESVYYNVDEISFAITSDKQIQFKYFEYDVAKNRRYRRDGALYNASPFALLWDDQNYYMLAYDEAAGILKHYRVDKMAEIKALEISREGKEEFEKVDMSAYSQKVFGMFRGDQTNVRMRFANHLAGAVVDRFGKDIMLVPENDEHFTVTAEIAVSGQFFAWIFGFGTECEILSPENVRAEMKAYTKSVLEMY
ncbi:MAG: WYL domain-containing protein [Oscillospiraceae bacterium]|nr:WYL domain-containing protein [Oscillospiraceae bacterium]